MHIITGLDALLNIQGITYLLIGSFIGVVVGVIPGLGGIVLLTMVLAFISHISLIGAICLFLATQAAGYFSASITSILLNTPAHPEAFAVTFDGFPMARRGEAGRALGISAASTCAGGLCGCMIFVALMPLVNKLPLIFHPPELALLVIIAMLLVATLGAESVTKALISVGVGLMIASIGASPITGDYRYTFNAVGLLDGVSLVALALGSFAIPQMVLVFGTATTIARQDMMGRSVSGTEAVQLEAGFRSQVMGGVAETFRHWGLVIQSGVIGALTGIIPGIGGFAANFLSYGIAQQTSKNRKAFGSGAPEGIIAPEGSSLSKEAGGLLPIIGLGIPGGVGGALFIAALAIKGVKVGFGFTVQYPSLPYTMIWVVAIGGVLGTGIGVASASTLARVTRVPGPALLPFIMCLSVMGAFVANVSFFAVMELLVFAVIGFLLRRLKYSLASFAIGLVLAPYLEQDVDLTANIYPHFIWLRRPMSDVLLALALTILVAKGVEMHRRTVRERQAIKEKRRGSVSDSLDPETRKALWLLESERNPHPLLSCIVAGSVTGLAIAFALYGFAHYDFLTGVTPEVASVIAAAAGMWQFCVDARGYVRSLEYRRERDKSEGRRLPRPAVSVMHAEATVITRLSIDDDNANGRSNNLPGTATSRTSRFPTIREGEWGTSGQFGREVFGFCWLGGLIVTSYVFGFDIGLPAFCLAYGLTSMGRVMNSLAKRVVFAVGSATIMWATSYMMLNALHVTFSPVVHL